MTPEQMVIALAAIYVVVFGGVVLLLYRMYEKRLAGLSRRLDETPARVDKALGELRGQLQAAGNARAALDARVTEFEKRLNQALSDNEKTARAAMEAFQQRLDQLTQTFHDYQETSRTWLEKTLEVMAKRWTGAGSREPSEDIEKVRLFKERMPRYEEKFTELADKHRELGLSVKRLIDQHKLLADRMQSAASEEEQKECQRQISALFLSLARTLNNSRDVFAGGEDALGEFVKEMSPLFKVCDLCGDVHEMLSICLNCGKKYCEECKGLQIGHCKECAPYYKPLHIEVNEQ
jgi:FtsZ-binding cell division protein ZapB